MLGEVTFGEPKDKKSQGTESLANVQPVATEFNKRYITEEFEIEVVHQLDFPQDSNTCNICGEHVPLDHLMHWFIAHNCMIPDSISDKFSTGDFKSIQGEIGNFQHVLSVEGEYQLLTGFEKILA